MGLERLIKPHILGLESYQPGKPVEELERELDDLLERWGSRLESRDSAAPLDAEQLARLAALGYVDVGRVPTTVTLADPKSMMPVWNRIKYADHLCNQDRCAEAIEEIEQLSSL